MSGTGPAPLWGESAADVIIPVLELRGVSHDLAVDLSADILFALDNAGWSVTKRSNGGVS